MTDLLLVSIAGQDRPGVTHALTEILGQHDVRILDIGQAVIHDTLSLGMLVQVPGGADHAPLSKDLQRAAHALGQQLSCVPVSPTEYGAWVAQQGKPRFILTLLGRTIGARPIARLSGIVGRQGLNIDTIRRLSGRVPLGPEVQAPPACVEFSLRGVPADVHALRTEILALSSALAVDVAIQEDTLYRRHRRLVAFDMDSTLIQAEVIDRLAEAAGAGEQVARITAAAMAGELDFAESLHRRVATLQGLPLPVVDALADALPLTEGVESLTTTLKALGYRLALLSGGFLRVGRRLAAQLGVDHVHANQLEVADGQLTGRLIGPLIDGAAKARLLVQIAADAGIHREQTVAVGDGANDLAMLEAAGMGIAFHAKPLVRQSAEHAISTLGLDSLLYLLGIRAHERDAI